MAGDRTQILSAVNKIWAGQAWADTLGGQMKLTISTLIHAKASRDTDEPAP
jgi:hypothetical protein